MVDGEDYGRTIITLRSDTGRPGLGRLLSSESYPIPYKSYFLGSVDQYVLVRMAENISAESTTRIALTAKMISATSPSEGLEIMAQYGDAASADIFCYMTEGFFLVSQIYPDFLQLLVSTGDAQIVTEDDLWGENIVGRALETTREDIEDLLWQNESLRLETAN